jgi:membrane-associated phospholipid phosphatase
LGNLRKAEVGTYSMPSGDAAAAALFCFLYATMVNLPLVYLLLPLVMLGRVYYHCHWFGDTFFGAVVGTLWGLVAFS